MTHEIKDIFHQVFLWQSEGKESVLATVVEVEGSSYRNPGVRMLVNNAGETFGAVSGGCIEKEVQTQAQSVFQTQTPKMMTYDGRFRLGCEGIIFILLEPLIIGEDTVKKLDQTLSARKLP